MLSQIRVFSLRMVATHYQTPPRSTSISNLGVFSRAIPTTMIDRQAE
jgi:hypothetical protein